MDNIIIKTDISQEELKAKIFALCNEELAVHIDTDAKGDLIYKDPRSGDIHTIGLLVTTKLHIFDGPVFLNDVNQKKIRMDLNKNYKPLKLLKRFQDLIAHFENKYNKCSK